MKYIRFKDFTREFFINLMTEAIKDGVLNEQIDEEIRYWKQTYEPLDTFNITLRLKLPMFQVLPDEEPNLPG